MAPYAGEAEPIVFDIEAGSGGAIFEDAIAFIVEEKIRRPIASVKIGDRVVVLIESQIVGVEAKIDVQTSVPIVVGDGGMREGAGRWIGKSEGIRLKQEFSVTLVSEEQRTAGADDEKILVPAIFEIGEQRARRAVEYPDAR